MRYLFNVVTNNNKKRLFVIAENFAEVERKFLDLRNKHPGFGEIECINFLAAEDVDDCRILLEDFEGI